ncbi:hypothetical protein SCHPADRAFT_993016 [Schizopora paradoxa]|uniref:Uncharacterized protein n=1 Tax=Schizopora paradoxa TaxID=27342 RepID=A0A0H2SBZ1_9AGAM|nr:hypothetical protein SCHPADRAFT_993016 [Schizopora paradoxa]
MSNSLAHPPRYYSAEELQQQQMMRASSNVLRPSVDGPKCPAPAPANAGESRFAFMHPPAGPVRTVVYPSTPLSHDDGFTQNSQLSKIATKDALSFRANGTTRTGYPPEKSADARPTNAPPMIHLTHSDYDKILKDAYSKGIYAGYAQGRVDGYQDALKGKMHRGPRTGDSEVLLRSTSPPCLLPNHIRGVNMNNMLTIQSPNQSVNSSLITILLEILVSTSLALRLRCQVSRLHRRFRQSIRRTGSQRQTLLLLLLKEQPPDEGARNVQSDQGNGYPFYGGHFID